METGEQIRATRGARGVVGAALGAAAALILALAMFGAVTLFSQLTTGEDVATAAGMMAMHPPVANAGGGTLPAIATQQPSFDEMVKVCNEHMASMASMMGMMQGVPGMGSGAR